MSAAKDWWGLLADLCTPARPESLRVSGRSTIRPRANSCGTSIPRCLVRGTSPPEPRCAPLSSRSQSRNAGGRRIIGRPLYCRVNGDSVSMPAPGRREWNLNEESFRRLLAFVDSDSQRAGEGYEKVREKLTRFFEWNGCI